MPQPRLEFWYEFGSTYSYLSAMRIEDLAANMDVDVDWRPFLLGPIFKMHGWNTSPFNIYPDKGRFMVRDLERTCAERNLVFHLPDPFPANSLSAARLAIIGADEGWVSDFSTAVFDLEFAQRQDIEQNEVLARALCRIDLNPADYLARANSGEVKKRLRAQTDMAVSNGIFGAPTFRTDSGELFWGDDRLEQALAWAGGAHEWQDLTTVPASQRFKEV